VVLAGGIDILVGRVAGVVSGAAEGDVGVDVDDEAPAKMVPEPNVDEDDEPTETPGNISKIILPTSTPAPPFPQLRLLHESATVGLNDGDEEASDA
jgi:hypothetical protein